MKLTKAQIVGSISEQLGFTRRRSIETVETLLEIMKKTLEPSENIIISDFDKFCIQEKGTKGTETGNRG